MKKIKKILTAIGNPILNNELKKINNFKIINNDVQYQDGIIEILEKNSEINFIILSQLIPGIYKLDELIEKIMEFNSNIKIIIILEKIDNNLEKILIHKGVYRIFYDNELEINNIIKIINEDEKMEKYNEEIRKEINELKEYIKNKNYKENNLKNKNNKNNKNNKKENNYLLKKQYNNILKINNNYYKSEFGKNKFKMKNNKIKNNKDIINKINKNLLQNTIIKKYFLNKINNKKLLNKLFISQKNNNKIISILGNNGSGKSIFSIMLANSYKKISNKILIIDFDILNNSLHTILGVKKYSEKIKSIMSNSDFSKIINIENLIININKNIDLISGINLVFDSNSKINQEKIKKILEKLRNNYDVIIIDTTSECFFEYTKEIINCSDKCIFLTEANLLELSKSKRILELYKNNWNIEKNKIEIIFNKYNENCIDIKLLKIIFEEYKILGYIKLKNDYNCLINNNFVNINFKNNLMKNYQKINKKMYEI